MVCPEVAGEAVLDGLDVPSSLVEGRRKGRGREVKMQAADGEQLGQHLIADLASKCASAAYATDRRNAAAADARRESAN